MMVRWAFNLAEALLSESLPRRWAHTKGVGARATELAALLGGRAETLHAAALLHDIGYVPPLAMTGFHPLDGARHLRGLGGVDNQVVRLVANHSHALLEAEERGLRAELAAEFPMPDDEMLVDALVFCDMTTTPAGERTSPEERVREVVRRYGAETVVGRFIRRAEQEIHASCGRVREAAAVAGVAV